ncbi:MAG: hypothetical protein GXY60_13230 [Spirochaetales bacterium]|nr:hypothetical protein [Spirochaetales bacterium]
MKKMSRLELVFAVCARWSKPSTQRVKKPARCRPLKVLTRMMRTKRCTGRGAEKLAAS